MLFIDNNYFVSEDHTFVDIMNQSDIPLRRGNEVYVIKVNKSDTFFNLSSGLRDLVVSSEDFEYLKPFRAVTFKDRLKLEFFRKDGKLTSELSNPISMKTAYAILNRLDSVEDVSSAIAIIKNI